MIQTEPNDPRYGGSKVRAGSVVANNELVSLRDQVKDLETTVNINKDIIKNMMTAAAGGSQESKNLHQAWQLMQKEQNLL